MASASVNEQVIQAVLTTLSEIEVGADYWIRPDKVYRVSAWQNEWLDESLNAVYFLVPDEDVDSELDYCGTEEIVRANLVLCHRFKRATENPARVEPPDRAELQGRMIQDVKKALRTSLTLGGVALHVQLPLASRSPQDTYEEGWAVALVMLEVQCQFRDAEP